MGVSDGQCCICCAGIIRAIFQPLISQWRGAAGRDGKRNIAALRNSCVCRLRCDGGRSQHRQRGGSAGGAANGVGDSYRIIRRVRYRHIGEGERGGSCAGNLNIIFQPLISERSRAAGGDAESNIAAGENGCADRQRRDGRRDSHGQRGSWADDTSETRTFWA